MNFEIIDPRELARRLSVPTTWVYDQIRSRAEDPIPCLKLGKYRRFRWGSPDLEAWLERRLK